MTPAVGVDYETFHGKRHFPAWPAPGALLGWGVTPIGYDLLWRVTGDDPDDWPVVVVGHREGWAYELPYGMAEFFVRMLGDSRGRPVDLRDILGHPHSRFLSAGEQRALEAAGQDPWEYVDEFLERQEAERAEQEVVRWIFEPVCSHADLPPVGRLTVEGFGMAGDELRLSATLDEEPSGPVRVSLYVEGPSGSFLRREGLVPVVERVNGLLVLDVRLPESMNGSGMAWPEMVDAMGREEDWSLTLSVTDPAIAEARARQGIVVGHGMQESTVDTALGVWP
ncbi:hypothetical protein ACL02U_15140 [Streptomyces sp. MS06]|uniref:hypothetical protein n=1 Tax=Streptomyces sp. MS06 TaxID=3385974 RepID=UPI00399FC84C